MNQSLTIRLAQPEDSAELSRLGWRTFWTTFIESNSESDMQEYLEKTFFPEEQKREIADPDRRIYLAFSGAEMVGYLYLRFSEPHASVSARDAVEIQRLYVDEKFFGRGLAKQLMEKALETCERMGRRTIWLGVWEKNFRAQAFYKKWGFRVVGEQGFQLGSDLQRDLVLERAV